MICALLDVSPRDRRLCVLPGWHERERERADPYEELFSRQVAPPHPHPTDPREWQLTRRGRRRPAHAPMSRL